MSNLELIAIVTGLLGHWFISNRDVRGYYVWICGNLVTIYMQYQVGLNGMAVLFFIYTIFSIYGIIKWKKLENTKDK